jgi:uncharacterized protein
MKFIALLFPLMAFADQVTFDKKEIKIDGTAITVQIADTPVRQEHGLMFVKSLPADEGMLFIFQNEQTLNFWMKNTLIPLAIGFFDAKGTLIDVQEMKPADSVMVKDPPTYPSAKPSLYALEMNTGWFSRRHIKKGAHLILPRQSRVSAGPSSRESNKDANESGR